MVKQQRALETRAAIIDAAARLFAAKGYVSTSLNEIVHAVDVTQGALYFHFASKADLAAEVMRLQHDASIRVGVRHLEEQESGLVGIVLVSGELARQILRDPVVRAGLRLSTETIEELADAVQAPYGEWASTARLFLAKAQAAGETRAGLDLDTAAEVIGSVFTGTQFFSTAETGGADLIERLGRMWTVMMPALARDPHHAAIRDAADLVHGPLADLR